MAGGGLKASFIYMAFLASRPKGPKEAETPLP